MIKRWTGDWADPGNPLRDPPAFINPERPIPFPPGFPIASNISSPHPRKTLGDPDPAPEATTLTTLPTQVGDRIELVVRLDGDNYYGLLESDPTVSETQQLEGVLQLDELGSLDRQFADAFARGGVDGRRERGGDDRRAWLPYAGVRFLRRNDGHVDSLG